MPQRSGDDRGETQRESRNQPSDDGRRSDARAEDDHGLTAWFTSTAVRAGLTVIGVVLLLFALGQAVGLPLLEFAVDAVSSETGRWLVVAFFALLLIGAAQRISTAT